MFFEAYGFVEDMIEEDILNCKKLLKKAKSKQFSADLQRKLNQLISQKRSIASKDKNNSFLSKLKKEELKKVFKGKKPYYLKKKDLAKLQQAEKFEKLKKEGKLKQWLEKKRKKVKSRDAKKMI